jgi:hypothetical protein
MTGQEPNGRARFTKLRHLTEMHPEVWGNASKAAAQLTRAREATRRQRAAPRETGPGPDGRLTPLEHAEIDEAIARTAFYAALDDLEAGS